MAAYRRKSVEIEAFWLDKNTTEFPDWWREARESGKIKIHEGRSGQVWYTILNLEGKPRTLQPENYMLFYSLTGDIIPVSKDFFEATYEKINE